MDEYENLKNTDKVLIAMEEMPEEFVLALSEPYRNLEQAALNHLMDA